MSRRTYPAAPASRRLAKTFNLFLPIFQKQLETFRSAEDNTLRRCHAIDSDGRTIWISGAHRDDGERLVVHADELSGQLTRTRERVKGDRRDAKKEWRKVNLSQLFGLPRANDVKKDGYEIEKVRSRMRDQKQTRSERDWNIRD